MLDKQKIKVGISPLTWSNDQRPGIGESIPFEQCISEMALTGYEGTEIGRKYPEDPAVLKSMLELRGLQITNAWFSSFLTTGKYEEAEKYFIQKRDILHALGAKIVGVCEQGLAIQDFPDVNIFEEKPVFSDKQWDKMAVGLNRLGKLARKKDMYVAFHHHMSTGVQTMDEIDRLMDMTDPNLVYLLYDTGHLAVADVDCKVVLEKYIDRIKHVHLKDIRKKEFDTARRDGYSFLDCVDEGVFTVPGDGMIDFKPLFDIIGESGYKGWMIVEAEQRPEKANPFVYAKKAREYIRETAGI